MWEGMRTSCLFNEALLQNVEDQRVSGARELIQASVRAYLDRRPVPASVYTSGFYMKRELN